MTGVFLSLSGKAGGGGDGEAVISARFPEESVASVNIVRNLIILNWE
jgi:hypothetical protein